MVGPRAVVLVLLALLMAAGVATFWPEDDLLPLVASDRTAEASPPDAALRPASGAIVDTDAAVLERILVADSDATEPAVAIAEITPGARARYDAWIHDLRNDDVRGNAGTALRSLRDPEAEPLLHEALHSGDAQQRQLAGAALVCFRRSPSPRLAEVLVESMHESVETELRQTLACSSAIMATRYLYHHPNGARAALRRALWSGDTQQRFLAAFLLGCDRSTEDLAMIVRELVGHLADNHTSGDAMMAAHALYRLGRPVVASLLGWRHHVDEQARQLIDLIVLDIESPPRNRTELRARSRMHSVTGVYHDPVVEFNVDRSTLATQ